MVAPHLTPHPPQQGPHLVTWSNTNSCSAPSRLSTRVVAEPGVAEWQPHVLVAHLRRCRGGDEGSVFTTLSNPQPQHPFVAPRPATAGPTIVPMRAGGHPPHPHGSQLLSTRAASPCPAPLSHSPSGPSKPTAKGISTGDLSAPPGPSLVCCLALMVKVLAAEGGQVEGK